MVLNCRSSGERPTVALNGLLAGLTLQNPALRLKTPAFRLQTKPNRTDTHELPINRSAVSVLVIIYDGSPAHLHFAQNSIFLNAAMQRFFGSAVRPPNPPADRSAEQPDASIRLHGTLWTDSRKSPSEVPSDNLRNRR